MLGDVSDKETFPAVTHYDSQSLLREGRLALLDNEAALQEKELED